MAGSLLGSFVAGTLVDVFGRKKCISIANFVIIIGYAVQGTLKIYLRRTQVLFFLDGKRIGWWLSRSVADVLTMRT